MHKQEKEEYTREMEHTREIHKDDTQSVARFPTHLREQMDIDIAIDPEILAMEKPEFKGKEVRTCISKMKNRKVSGPDGLKAELFRRRLSAEGAKPESNNRWKSDLGHVCGWVVYGIWNYLANQGT